MTNYVITLSSEDERAEEASLILDSSAIFKSDEPVLIQVQHLLKSKGFSPDIAVSAMEIKEYFHDVRLSDNWPSREENRFIATVTVEHMFTVDEWMSFFRQHDDIFQTIGKQNALEVFRGVLSDEKAIRYDTLQSLLDRYEISVPYDFKLVKADCEVPGFDDICYLFHDVDWNRDNFAELIKQFTKTDCEWLYERNAQSINLWIWEQEKDLLSVQHNTNHDMSFCAGLAQLWALDTVGCYFNSEFE